MRHLLNDWLKKFNWNQGCSLQLGAPALQCISRMKMAGYHAPTQQSCKDCNDWDWNPKFPIQTCQSHCQFCLVSKVPSKHVGSAPAHALLGELLCRGARRQARSHEYLWLNAGIWLRFDYSGSICISAPFVLPFFVFVTKPDSTCTGIVPSIRLLEACKFVQQQPTICYAAGRFDHSINPFIMFYWLALLWPFSLGTGHQFAFNLTSGRSFTKQPRMRWWADSISSSLLEWVDCCFSPRKFDSRSLSGMKSTYTGYSVNCAVLIVFLFCKQYVLVWSCLYMRWLIDVCDDEKHVHMTCGMVCTHVTCLCTHSH